MTTKIATTTEREDLRFWLDTVYDGRQAIDATIRKYGETPALVAAQEALNVAISEYRHRIHELVVR